MISSNMKILTTLFLLLELPLIYPQSSNSKNEAVDFNQKVIDVFNDIIYNREPYEVETQRIESLKTSPYSKYESYNELVNQVLPGLLEGIKNNDKILTDTLIQRGKNLINTANSKLVELIKSMPKNTGLKDSTQNKTSVFSKGTENRTNAEDKTVRNYKIKIGDNLWKIAEKELANGMDWIKIFDVNKSLITNPDIIFPNQEIAIPTENKENNLSKDSLLSSKKGIVKVYQSNDALLNMEQKKETQDIELNGMIVDQTQSKWGKDFFDLFNSGWIPPEITASYTITIGEKMLPGLKTQIIININGDDIYQNFIQPRYDNIVEAASEVIEIASMYLKNYEEIQAEIQGTDLKGTGIY